MYTGQNEGQLTAASFLCSFPEIHSRALFISNSTYSAVQVLSASASWPMTLTLAIISVNVTSGWNRGSGQSDPALYCLLPPNQQDSLCYSEHKYVYTDHVQIHTWGIYMLRLNYIGHHSSYRLQRDHYVVRLKPRSAPNHFIKEVTNSFIRMHLFTCICGSGIV